MPRRKGKLTKTDPTKQNGSMCWRYSDKFRVRLDELGDPRIELTGQTNFQQFVYDHGPESFGVWIESGHPKLTFNKIKAQFPTAKLEQEGDIEITFSFAPESEREAVKFLAALRCEKKATREYTPEQKAALVERGKKLAAMRSPKSAAE